MTDRAAEFQQHRSLLFSVAYRMLGRVADAEDIVQDAWLRWQNAPVTEIRSPKSYLATITTRLCLDHLRSAEVKRKEYIGPWVPEPLPASRMPDETMADSLSQAFLMLLESLTPVERAAFLLREVFDYEYAEIAGILERSEAACRQLVKRARDHIAARRPRFPAPREEQLRLADRFFQACATGDLAGLEALLARDVTLYSDGGGRVLSARNPIYGADHVARFLLGVLKKPPPGFRTEKAWINGQPGAVNYVGDRVFNTLALDVDDGRICGIYIVANPEKLRAVTW
jgi:RNA polymerase sigma-70 factor (ECF subfamily)